MSLKVEKVDEQRYILLEDISEVTENFKLTIKKGFDFDSASIPQVLWSIIGSPFTGNYVIPAIFHDALYACRAFNDRKTCDDIFLELMKKHNVGYLKRYAMYNAVRCFGQSSWDNQDLLEIKQYSKYCIIKPNI